MVVEAAILDCEHGLLHLSRNVRERDPAPALARAGHERAQQRRVERDLRDRGVADEQTRDSWLWIGTLRRDWRGPLYANDASTRRAGSRNEGDGVGLGREFASRHGMLSLRVAEVVEPGDDVGVRQRESSPQGQWTAEDSRNTADALPLEPGVNDDRESAVVVAREARSSE